MRRLGCSLGREEKGIYRLGGNCRGRVVGVGLDGPRRETGRILGELSVTG